jgi:hypothetical protein
VFADDKANVSFVFGLKPSKAVVIHHREHKERKEIKKSSFLCVLCVLCGK